MMNVLPKNKLPPNPKILLIKLRSIGDVIYNTSVYGPIKKAWPQARLTVIVEPPAYDMVRYHPDVDEVLVFEKKPIIKQIKFYFRLWRENYDIAIDMQEGPRGAIMCFLTFAQFCVGNDLAKRAFLYNVRLNFSEYGPKFPIDYQAGLIRKMGVPIEKPRPLVHIADVSRKRGKILLEKNGISWNESFCIIHPGARTYDQWQYEKFAELIDRLYESRRVKTVLTCGPGQRDQANAVRKKTLSTQCVFIEAGLQELGAITERSQFVICHNGGYMHLSAAVGTPVIALFGLSNPLIWHPMGEKHIVLHHKLDCFPCSSKTIHTACLAGKPECKELITVEEVLQAVNKIIGPIAS